MAIEPDKPPQSNTFRFMVWKTVQSLQYLRAYWGRRLIGGAIGIMADALAEGASQAFYARLPGHPQQAKDSLAQTGKDRDLYQFRGESDAAFAQRQRDYWEDSKQAGTPIQLVKVINQWGTAGWPATWITLTTASNIVENIGPVFAFNLIIPFGSIIPAWTPATYGGGHVYGESNFLYGVGPNTDLPMLLSLVRKWKGARDRCYLKVYYTASLFATFRI